MRKAICLLILLFSITYIIFSIEPAFGKFKYYPENINWQKTTTENFNIFYAKKEETIIPILAQFAEDAYSLNQDIFESSIKKKINIIIYASPVYFSQNQIYPSFLPPNVAGFATFKQDRIVIPFNGNLKKFQELVFHETSHIFQYHKFLKNPLTGILAEKIMLSTWIFEGLSENAVGDFTADGYMVLKDAVINGYIHDMEYMKKSQNYDYLAYQQSHSMINFLHENYSKEKFDKFLRNVNLTLNLDKSLKNIYGFNYSEFYFKWKNYISKKILTNNEAKESVLARKNTELIKNNNIFLFKNENFYLEYRDNTLVRKSLKEKSYKEEIFKSTPFSYLLFSEDYIDISKKEFYTVFLFYKNNDYYIGIYNFINKSLKTVQCPAVTNIEKIKFIDQNVYILANRGLKSIIYKVDTDYKISNYKKSEKNIKDFTIINNNIIYAASYGPKSYIHINNKIKQLNGEVQSLKRYSDDSVIMLLHKNRNSFLAHLNLKTLEVNKFKDFKESITDFSFTKDNLILKIYNNKKNLTVKSSFFEYTNNLETKDIYKVPRIEDDINYKIENMTAEKPSLLPRFENIFTGISIEENKYINIALGSSFNNILNESIINWQVSKFINADSSFDFSVNYLKTGNRPNYKINLSKSTTFRNDKEYYKNKLRGTLIYPLSISSSINFTGGYYLQGFDTDSLDNNLFLGTYFTNDTAYGRIFPFYGKRIFVYGGYLSSSKLNFEFKLDSRFYHLPFMMRFFYQTSELNYFDDTYIRGYRNRYFAKNNKIVFNSEFRIPVALSIPTLRTNKNLGLLTLYSFFDMALFTDDLSEVKYYKNDKLVDPISSIGYGFSIHLSNRFSFDFSFAHKTDLDSVKENPVFEFSINKELY